MRKLLLSFYCLPLIVSLSAQDSFQLAPPLLKYSSIFFSKQTSLTIKFIQPGAKVYYTTNNEEPTEQSNVYVKPVTISKNFTTIKAKAIGNNFTPSSTESVSFIKDGLPIKNVEFTKPNDKYPGSGSNTLFDNKGGNPAANNNTWLGYDCDTVTISLTLKKEKLIQSVLLNFLQNEPGWIFLPEQITAEWYNKKTNSYQLLATENISSEKETAGSSCVYRLLSSAQKIKTDKIRIHILVKKSIPSWHPGKGNHAWMFIDEVKVY
ncbi:MAG: chitobiase/beta-hexosaminidase C-terminal domain-containing protein [Sphingobacteriales bacterium]|nr:chitobiase/beta-hexosaminidase C-terminal domain-containing protein [Sphingobacteriales bacterium]MBI3719819.1 chitobiase/beta-hexosaminidase C-terminal domain-containing protein [Sphingobacteriales bacterium]